MSRHRSFRTKALLHAALCVALLAGASAAVAQDIATTTPPSSVTLELIDRLAASGFLKPEDAASLRARAERESRVAIAELAAARVSAEEAARCAQEAAQQVRAQLAQLDASGAAPQLAGARLSAEQAAQRAELAASRTRASLASVAGYAPAGDAAAEAPAGDDTVRVTYIPEVVKEQLRDEIRQQVMAQAYEEKWAAPRAYPDWLSRYKFFADVRLRYEGIFYPKGNDTASASVNYNSINTGAPYDNSKENNTTFMPRYNADQDRQRLRLRARLGVAGDLGDGFTAGLRLGTGENNSPVSQNQTLGAAANAQGGNFSKYAIWLDRGFLKYEHGLGEGSNLALTAGRFDNPFLSTPVIWADELGFDGAALAVRKRIGEAFTPFVTAGAFPVFNTDLNFPSTGNPNPVSGGSDKFASTDKWLYAGQTGVAVQLSKDFKLTLAGALYDFQGVEGRLSTPYIPLTTADAGDTDATRPSFAQKGNTYMELHSFDNTTGLNNYGGKLQYQYYGLVTPFREVAVTAKLDYDHFQPFQVSLMGEFVRNTAFDARAIEASARPANNVGTHADINDTAPLPFLGSGDAWYLALKFGHLALQKRWDWNMTVGYRRVGSDAVVDAFTDSDFGGGGTNLKGYSLGGNLAVSPRVWLGMRWLSAEQVSGSTFKNDTLQFDLNGKF